MTEEEFYEKHWSSDELRDAYNAPYREKAEKLGRMPYQRRRSRKRRIRMDRKTVSAAYRLILRGKDITAKELDKYFKDNSVSMRQFRTMKHEFNYEYVVNSPEHKSFNSIWGYTISGNKKYQIYGFELVNGVYRFGFIDYFDDMKIVDKDPKIVERSAQMGRDLVEKNRFWTATCKFCGDLSYYTREYDQLFGLQITLSADRKREVLPMFMSDTTFIEGFICDCKKKQKIKEYKKNNPDKKTVEKKARSDKFYARQLKEQLVAGAQSILDRFKK